MALPADLRQLIFSYTRFATLEPFANILPVSLWQTRYGSVLLMLPGRVNHVLPFALRAAKIASLLGEPGYINQAFLPAPVALQVATTDERHEIFLDVLHRLAVGKITRNTIISDRYYAGYFYAFLAALRQADGVKLAWLLAARLVPDRYEQIIVLAWELQKFRLPDLHLYYLRHFLRSDGNHYGMFRDFFSGYVAARGLLELQPEDFDQEIFCLGYLVGDGPEKARIKTMRASLLNSRDTSGPISDFTMLADLVTTAMRRLPQGHNLPFRNTLPLALPAAHIPHAELRARAAEALELLPKIYAPSVELTRYLLNLRFILDPAAIYSAVEQSEINPLLLLTFAKQRDLQRALDDYDASYGYYTENLGMVTKQLLQSLAHLSANAIQLDGMMIRAWRNILPSLIYQQQMLPLLTDENLPKVWEHDDLGEIYFALAEHQILRNTAKNSYALQVALPLFPTVEVSNNEIELSDGNIIFSSHPLTNYEARSWQNYGIMLVTGISTTDDGLHQRVREYLALTVIPRNN